MSGFGSQVSAVNTRILTGVAIIFSFAVTLSAADGESLPKIKPAPEFTLTNQDGKRLALKELRGKVLAITFIFASCVDTCPLLTAKMAGIQNRLGNGLRPTGQFRFHHRGPGAGYAGRSSSAMPKAQANSAGWAFLTGTSAEIREVAKRYGIYYKKTPRGDVDHTFLTSLVDQSGTLRVQYMGVKFDPDEMLRDHSARCTGAEIILDRETEEYSPEEPLSHRGGTENAEKRKLIISENSASLQ